MAHQLTAEEQLALARLEAKVSAGIGSVMAMIEAGKALAEIRRRQLYRATAASWDAYVESKFQTTRRRADQIIAFAGVHDVLEETGTRVPGLSEKAARPLAGLPADELKAVVAEAAEEGEVTPATLRKAALRRKGKAKAKVPRPRRFKVPGAVVVVTFNRKATGSVIEALSAAIRQAEDVDHQAGEAA